MNKKKLRAKKKLLQRIEKRYVGFHVYRSVNEQLPFAFWERLTDEPIPDGSFDDPTLGVGDRFYYKLTQVASDGSESAPFSPDVAYRDHAGNTHAQNPLADFAGYNIYRSADKNVPFDQWERRNAEPLPTTEFKDEGVTSGEAYFYYIRGVDSQGNETAPGEVVRVIRA